MILSDGIWMRDRVAQRRRKAAVLGVVVGAMAQILAKLRDFLALRIVNDNAEAGRAGIAPGSAVDVGGVGGRSTWKEFKGKENSRLSVVSYQSSVKAKAPEFRQRWRYVGSKMQIPPSGRNENNDRENRSCFS